MYSKQDYLKYYRIEFSIYFIKYFMINELLTFNSFYLRTVPWVRRAPRNARSPRYHSLAEFRVGWQQRESFRVSHYFCDIAFRDAIAISVGMKYY